MHMLNIHELLKTFCITEEDIQSCQKFKDKLPILSSILINRFYNEYLKDNKDLSHYFRYIDIEHLLKTMKEFIVFIYSNPLEENYIERIHTVGYIHADINLSSAKIKYGFFGINQLLNKMSTIDPFVNTNYLLLSKILAMVEYIIIDSSYKKIGASENISKNSSIWMLDKIYSAFSIHKDNYSKIEKIMTSDKKNIMDIDFIVDNPSECKFHKLLENFDDQSELLKVSGIDLNELNTLHIKWHELLCTLKSAIKDEDIEKQEIKFKELTLITNQLYELMDKPLKEFSTSGFLSLNAGLKAIYSIQSIFSKHDLLLDTQTDIQNNVINSVKESLQNTLAWAIKDIEIHSQELDSNNYDLMKKIKYREFNFYLGISLKPLVNKLYLKEILTLLLEALELNFSIKEREFTLIEYAQKAKSANRSKDIFLSSMSHELRTPLTAVNGFSEILMLRKDTPENIRGYIKKINIAGNNLLDLVNTILSFAKLDAGKMNFDPKLSSVFLVLKEVEILSMPMAQKKNITLNIMIDLHLYLMMDPKLFKQVLLNLVSNAIKFTQDGGEISLDINYEEKQKEYKFSICDNGIGISKENQKKLFQSFVQIENVYQKSESGSGLGLMICKKIIEKLHNGRIWVESEPDLGSCFHVTMPTINPATNSYCISNAPENSKHILIVEDSRIYRELLQEYLEEKFKLTFTETNNGAKGLLSAEKFDLIILDFYLTDGIGSEVLHYMEDENINIPVVVLSAEKDVTVAKTIYASSNIESILNKRDIKEFCHVLNNA